MPREAGDGKPRSDKRQRAASVLVRLTDAELAEIEARAERAGTTRADYMRAAALGQELSKKRAMTKDDRAITELAAAVYEVRKIGVNLNQIAHATNQTKTQPLPVIFDQVLSDIAVMIAKAQFAIGRL